MRPIVLLAGLALAASVWSIDHNNVDSGRPLRFDDAYSIAYRERAFELGFSLDTFRRIGPRYGAHFEFKYGFAKNQDFGIGFEPSYLTSDRRGDVGNVELSYFNGIRRETDGSPALAFRLDAGLPTGRDAEGLDVRLRGIATRHLGQYDRLHLNLDAHLASDPAPGERAATFGVILGYTTPLGYPTRFDQTLVAELAFQQSLDRDRGWTASFGLGLRQQISPRSVWDIGFEFDWLETKGRVQSPLRFRTGFSLSF